MPLPLHLPFEEFGEFAARVLDQLANSAVRSLVSEVEEVGVRDVHRLDLGVRPSQIVIGVYEFVACTLRVGECAVDACSAS